MTKVWFIGTSIRPMYSFSDIKNIMVRLVLSRILITISSKIIHQTLTWANQANSRSKYSTLMYLKLLI